jgi:hypothetical protein
MLSIYAYDIITYYVQHTRHHLILLNKAFIQLRFRIHLFEDISH